MAKNNNNYAKIVAHAWKDARFKEKLLKNPKAALKEMGVAIPESKDVRVIEDKVNTMTFVLPAAPAQARELSDQDLQKLAGGVWTDAPSMDEYGQARC
jgi:hypothetical protein